MNELINNEPEWLKDYRVKSLEKSKILAMPSFRHGLNIIINPEFNLENIKPRKINVDKKINSDARVKISSEVDEVVKKFLGDEWKEEQDENKVYYFNQAFFNDILLIEIPDNVELEKAIEINYSVKETPLISLILVVLGKNSKAQIIINKTSQQSQDYFSDDVRIIAQENSKLDFITIQNVSKDAVNFQKRKAVCKKDSLVNWIDVCLGSKYTKSDIITNLDEEGATTNNTVLYLGTDRQRYDIYTVSKHNSPTTFSNILTRGVLNKESKALSRGLIRIGENASGSNGYEKQDVLLISQKAEADAMPNLEIHNNDVKCSHGSTIGQVDAEQIFYLMSRGLNEEEAKQKIIEGYFLPVLDLIKDVSLKEKLQEKIMESIQ